MLFGKKSSAKTERVLGYTIRPISAAKFFDSLEEIENLIIEAAREIAPDGDYSTILKQISEKDVGTVVSAVFSTGKACADTIIRLTASLSGVPEDDLMSLPNIGIAGIADILLAVIRVNRFADFFGTALPGILSVWQGRNAMNENAAQSIG